jgi:hypothetical protein
VDLRLAELVLRALREEDADFVVDGEEGSESVSGFRQATVRGIPDAHAAAIADRVPSSPTVASCRTSDSRRRIGSSKRWRV